MSWPDLLAEDVAQRLRCPACKAAPLSLRDASLDCPACGESHPLDSARMIAALFSQDSRGGLKDNIRAWWGDLYEQLYGPTDRALDSGQMESLLDQTEDLFHRRQMAAVMEMPLDRLAGQEVLEIGPGGGAHSCLFKRHGASVTAIDITPQRAISTAFKLSLVKGGRGRAYNADAENLPFQDNSFDIVYSNGVLHHSEDTDKTIAEVFRVLKPGGKAILMLYARHSAVFWGSIVPHGLVSGEMFRWPEPQWIGRVTEGKPKFGQTKNPFTRVYSAKELDRLLAAFIHRRYRKSSFQWDNFAIPRLTQIRARLLRLLGHSAHPGGVLVYGAPFVPETKLELRLGRAIGFAWNIVAEKPA
ncbi:class I SAM-dependent methyltransferase [Magnetospirillum gryphiswaldense]|uniref:class I SAM-dependent methyltransferase n=1 Tax=Magnetospirillum gryphiswaldense TaxID=55518 RepID=UPI00131A150D|nr:class I SAM-dependent methyltransferase [Magnetospirillum gryphiswaldense]